MEVVAVTMDCDLGSGNSTYYPQFGCLCHRLVALMGNPSESGVVLKDSNRRSHCFECSSGQNLGSD